MNRSYLLKFAFRLAAVCLMALLPLLTQAQNLVTNGDFEVPSIGNNNNIVYQTGMSIGGWQVASGSVDVAHSWQQISGRQSLDICGNEAGTIYQDLQTVPGQPYILRLAIAPNPTVQGSTSPQIKQLQIMWGSTIVDTPTRNQAGYTASNMGWQYISYTVVASSTTIRLQFVSLTSGNGGMAIDDVSVTPVDAVPTQTITDLFSTGVDSTGSQLALGVSDPHYVNTANNIAPFTYYNDAYTSNPTSNWLSPTATGGNNGVYVVRYRTTFTLPENTLLRSVIITGFWATDDTGTDILINGNSTGFTTSDFTNFSYFALPATFYQVGQNTLDFRWKNLAGAGALNAYFNKMSFAFAPPSDATITGSLIQEGIVGYAAAQEATFIFRPVGGGSSFTRTVSVTPAGNFSIPGIPKTNYTVHIKGAKSLAANINIDATYGDVSGLMAFLPAGDTDNNNMVDIGDFGILISAYGSRSGDPTGGDYLTNADLNGDGKVDIVDFSLLVENYGLSGDL